MRDSSSAKLLSSSSGTTNNNQQQPQPWTDAKLFIVAFLVRIFLILYARIHDYFFDLNFTDIDYDVFSDAAQLVAEGKSPYGRTTYRYTPLIAWLLLPNRYFADFGKLLFSLVDVLVGWLQLRLLLLHHHKDQNHGKQQEQNHAQLIRTTVCLLWLFNPFNAIIATRGSSDSLICFLIILALYCLHKSEENGNANNSKSAKKWLYVSALVHGAGATHLRIFPIIYLPSIFLHLSSNGSNGSKWQGIRPLILACLWNGRGFCYMLLSLASFTALTGAFYMLYGRAFLDSFLLYHISRVDIRHNFSPYFLPLYLSMDNPGLTQMLGFVAFVPQLVCICCFALRYCHDLPFCWFLTTFAFVSFNKVSTSQYFIWYLCFLPLICTRIQMDFHRKVRLLFLWLFGQAQWLLPAYLLEFCGLNTFVWIWLASLLFLAINCYIMAQLVRAYENNNNLSPPADDDDLTNKLIRRNENETEAKEKKKKLL